jgi:phospholipid-transporting ATPase
MSFGLSQTTSSPRTCSSSRRLSQRVYATSRPRTLTGGLVCTRRLIVTDNLYSETNLKIKQAAHQTAHLTSPPLVNGLQGTLRSEQPNNSLYTYEGTLELRTAGGVARQVPLGPDQLLLRGAQIRNTPWLYGLVVFTGHQTKLMRNAT